MSLIFFQDLITLPKKCIGFNKNAKIWQNQRDPIFNDISLTAFPPKLT